MRFSRLCGEARLEGDRSGDAEVHRVVADSRQVRQGDCFVAVRGTGTDGHRYMAQAVAAGCTAVVCEDAAAVPPDLARAVVADTRSAVGRLAQAMAGWPGRKLTVAAVTGTNGKTTFTYLLRHVLRAAGHAAGLLGTVTYDTLASSEPAATTTPGPIELADMMARMVRAGATHLVMEVSSHALDQRRIDGVDVDVAVFTNLTGDHLDYHGTMERYLASKRRLFESLRPEAAAVLNRDDPHSDALAAATGARLLWYGFSPAADVWARIDAIEPGGSRFVIRRGDEEAPVRTALVGRHNIANCLAAAAAALALGEPLGAVARALGEVPRVPGRLQRVPADAPFEVLVDYAHTDDALRNVLAALQPIKTGRLILVFGCGGDRDRTKRPRMARVAEELADRVIVTSDNPRTEGPSAIIEEIVAGFSERGRARVRIEPDRRRAIAAAVDEARAGDLVLIAGKGHETYQVVGTERVHFDDVETAAEVLRGR